MTKRILITPGEPAGIGPDVLVQVAQAAHSDELVVIADADLLHARAKQLGLSIQLNDVDLLASPKPTPPGTLYILPVALTGQKVIAGKLNVEHAAYVLQTLNTAVSLCQKKQAHGIVTGPVHKGVINDAGISFSGHTEFLAQACGVSLTVMLFVLDQLKVAIATTHVPLRHVADLITQERLLATLRVLNAGLQQQFAITNPRILVSGLNPHAGEGGHLGREEIDVITPALQLARELGISVDGPLPADTLFTPMHLSQTDAVLAMYHDQALPLIKFLGFDRAVNVTLGLPFIRTSVDHGTALDIAGTGQANSGSMRAAIELCSQLMR